MKKILIIEDNQDVRENTADILELAGYELCTAENGKIGVEMARKMLPDFIICDIMMPELDGYQVLEELNKSTETSIIPFIFLTAKTEKVDFRKGMNLGADDYLTKPFTEKELLDAIESRLTKYDFLKHEFSQTMDGVSRFMEEAAQYLDLEHLSKDYALLEYNKKDFVFSEGNTANSLYFIESGVVKTFKSTEKGKEFDDFKAYKGGLNYYLLPWLNDNKGILEFVIDKKTATEAVNWMTASAEDYIKVLKEKGYTESEIRKL